MPRLWPSPNRLHPSLLGIALSRFNTNSITLVALSKLSPTVTIDFANCDYLSLSNDLVAHLRLKLSNLSPSETGNRASYLDPSEPTNSLKVPYDCLTSTLNIHAPFVTKQIVHRSIPWLTPNLRASIRECDKLFMRAKR